MDPLFQPSFDLLSEPHVPDFKKKMPPPPARRPLQPLTILSCGGVARTSPERLTSRKRRRELLPDALAELDKPQLPSLPAKLKLGRVSQSKGSSSKPSRLFHAADHVSDVADRALPSKRKTVKMKSLKVFSGLEGERTTTINGQLCPVKSVRMDGRTYSIARIGSGHDHLVWTFVGPATTTTLKTLKGPVSFKSDQVVIRQLQVGIGSATPSCLGTRKKHEEDLAAYDLYHSPPKDSQRPVLPVPRMLVRPDACNPKGKPHKDTFVDEEDETSGGFAIWEKVEAGFTMEGVESAPSIEELTGTTAELMDFAMGEWKKFVQHLARVVPAPYEKFPARTALFDDLAPRNVGRNASGFCYLDPMLPGQSADRILESSIHAFTKGNSKLTSEMISRLLEDDTLLTILGSKAKTKVFQDALREKISAALKRRSSKDGAGEVE